MQSKPVPLLSAKDVKRFWSKVNVSEDVNSCWEWAAKTIDGDGYGRMFLNGMEIGKQYQVRSNRIAYFLGSGINPAEFVVCHTCDNPKCCNPKHLFLGTSKENRQDCLKKNRQARGVTHGSVTKPYRVPRGDKNGSCTHPESRPKGAEHGMAKIKESDVLNIINTYQKGGVTQTKLAKEYNMTQANIWNIINKKSWQHLFK